MAGLPAFCRSSRPVAVTLADADNRISTAITFPARMPIPLCRVIKPHSAAHFYPVALPHFPAENQHPRPGGCHPVKGFLGRIRGVHPCTSETTGKHPCDRASSETVVCLRPSSSSRLSLIPPGSATRRPPKSAWDVEPRDKACCRD